MTTARSRNDAGTSRLEIVIVGPGRAGGALALAAVEAGHDIVGVLSRSEVSDYGPMLAWDQDLPQADLALVAVKDSAIEEVVARLRGHVGAVATVAHVSGYAPVEILAPLRPDGVAIGGFHPLQTLPDPVSGARALAGAYVGVGGEAKAALFGFGSSLGMVPFELSDQSRPGYHAASAAAANFVVVALAQAFELYRHAGVHPQVAQPLIEQVVANVFEMGAEAALTGPIARGDVETVNGHIAAAEAVSATMGKQFRLFAEATAIRAGREEDIKQWR